VQSLQSAEDGFVTLILSSPVWECFDQMNDGAKRAYGGGAARITEDDPPQAGYAYTRAEISCCRP